MEWLNVDDHWLRLYIQLNRDTSSDIIEIANLLPYRSEGRRWIEARMGSKECGERYVPGKTKESNWMWPNVVISRKDLKLFIGVALDMSVKFS